MAGDAHAQQRRHHTQRQCWIFSRLECGQRGFCVSHWPAAPGVIGTGSWGPNSKIENLSFWAWPNEINGEAVGRGEPQRRDLHGPAVVCDHVFEPVHALPVLWHRHGRAFDRERQLFCSQQPTADGSHWDGVTIYAANPVNIPLGNQNTFSNFNVYSSEGTTAGGSLGADTCFYFTALFNDQTGGIGDVLSLDHFKNLYCENEGGAHDVQMPIWEWDTLNSEIEDQHMGGGGEVYIGGAQQHWIGGNFNNGHGAPAINLGTQNTADYVANLGQEPKGNVYSSNSLINYGWGSEFNGHDVAVVLDAHGALWVPAERQQPGADPRADGGHFLHRELDPALYQHGGRLYFAGGVQREFLSLSRRPCRRAGPTMRRRRSPTPTWAATWATTPSSTYCNTYAFNQQGIPIGAGQRLVPGKYTLYISAKDAVTASNTAYIKLYSNCGGLLAMNFRFR